MAKKLPRSLDKLADLARSQLHVINSIWNSLSGDMLPILNRIRSVFGLANAGEAAQVYGTAKSFSQTSAGQAALGQRSVYDAWDIPVNPNLVPRGRASGQYRHVISFGFGDEYFSFIQWTHAPPSVDFIAASVAEYITEHIDAYKGLNNMMEMLDNGELDVRVRNAQRRF